MPVLLDTPTPTEARAPLVEQRLYSARVCLACLNRLALLAFTGRERMEMVADLPTFAWTARRFTMAAERHIRAVEAVLPLSATQVEAPSRKERS